MAGDPWAVQAVEPVAADPWAVKAVAPVAKPSLMQNVTGFMANVNRGLGIGDELAAAGNAAKDVITGNSGPNVVQTYKDELAHQRQIEDGFTADHPHVAALGRGVGNTLTMAAPIGPGAEAFQGAVPLVRGLEIPAGRAVNALRGGAAASVAGAGYAAVDRGTAAERLHAASDATHDPMTFALGAGGGALAHVAPKPARAQAPTLEQLTAQKDAAYRAVDQSGVQFTPQAFGGLLDDAAHAMDAAGFNAGLHPKAAAMMERLGQSNRGAGGYSPTLTQLDQLRQQIGRDVASSPDPGERRMGQIMRDRIDAFISGAGPDHITGTTDPAAAGEMIAQARDLNTRVQKLHSLDNLDAAAGDRAAVTGSGGNINNATRQNVLRFRNNTGNLSADEQAAANRVIRGTPAGNALRLAGKLSPSGNGLMAAGHLAAILPTHGASAAVGIGGAVAKVASEAITNRNVRALRDLIASGGQAAQEVSRQLADPQYADLRAQLANDLSFQAGVQGASRRGAVTAEVVGHPEYGVGVSSR